MASIGKHDKVIHDTEANILIVRNEIETITAMVNANQQQQQQQQRKRNRSSFVSSRGNDKSRVEDDPRPLPTPPSAHNDKNRALP